MYRRFGYPKFLCCLPHGRMIVYYVVGDRNRAFLNIFLQENPPARTFLHTYAGCVVSMNGYPHSFFRLIYETLYESRNMFIGQVTAI